MELRQSTLPAVDPRVIVPRYDRAALSRSIVHIGLGGFARAHLAAYIDYPLSALRHGGVRHALDLIVGRP